MNELALYNEIDDFAADWLENLIRADLIAPGVVDRRSIVDLTPDDVARYRQVHFFAGIGIWSYAMRRAGIPDSAPIWTGSCPCQPFSAAGKGGGFDDERHLWPAFFHLIEQCRPAVVLGEQVASKDGLAWLDLVQTDMEGADYAIGAVDTCSASVGAPHIRQRLRFAAVRMADADDAGPQGRLRVPERADQRAPGALGMDGGLAFPNSAGLLERQRDDQAARHGHSSAAAGGDDRHQFAGPTNGFWRDADWLFCRDGKWRPVEPGTFPLAASLPKGLGSGGTELRRLARVAGLDSKSLARAKAFRIGALRGYGNAVDAEATREFCEAVIASIGGIT